MIRLLQGKNEGWTEMIGKLKSVKNGFDCIAIFNIFCRGLSVFKNVLSCAHKIKEIAFPRVGVFKIVQHVPRFPIETFNAT